MELPSDDWTLQQEQLSSDGSGFYYFLTSDGRLLNFSIFLERSSECDSGASCRALYWDNPDDLRKDPRGVRYFKRGIFSVVKFDLRMLEVSLLFRPTFRRMNIESGIGLISIYRKLPRNLQIQNRCFSSWILSRSKMCPNKALQTPGSCAAWTSVPR